MKFSLPLRALAGVCALLLLLTGCQTPAGPAETTDTHSPATEGTLAVPDLSGAETEAPPAPITPADNGLPTISIDVKGSRLFTNTTTYHDGTLTVSGAENELYNITVKTQIRGRGHSSFDGKAEWTDYASKNSYRLKLDTKQNLLGVGGDADKDWVLISGKFDASALRNFLVWDLAERMGTIPYVPSCTWVNLYVNGDYRGLYSLVEKTDVGGDKVNIVECDSTDPDVVSYFVEFDLRGAYRKGAKEWLTYFYIPGVSDQFAWVVKSEVYNTSVTAAIRQHLITCHNAIMSGSRELMATHVDMASFVDMFILQELSKNPDAGCSSFYMQRNKGGKLALTAPWDFDFALGSYSVSQTTTGLVADGENVMSHPWFEFLATQPWFMAEVADRMKEIAPLMAETLAAVEAQGALLTAAADDNDARWNIYGEKFSIFPADQVSVRLKSYQEHVDFLTRWTAERWENLLKLCEKKGK